MNLQLYIEGQRVELFKDESVSINSSVQSINDISKTFSDYSQSFSVPASNSNNLIFKFWDKAEISNGFDARTRKDARIYLNHMPYKIGKIQLNGAKNKDGKIYAYQLTFFGNVVKLSDLFGDDLLTDLDLSAYEHDYNGANVKLGLEGETLLSGNVIYPMFSPKRIWTFGDGSVTDLKDATTTGGLYYYELKPALKLKAITDAIQSKYGITFTDTFLNTDDFKKLFMWASREKDYINASGVPVDLIFDGSVEGYGSAEQYFSTQPSLTGYSQSKFVMTVTPEAGFESVPYTIIMTVNGVDTTFNYTGTKSALYQTFSTSIEQLSFKVQSTEPFQFVGDLLFYSVLTGVPTDQFVGDTGVTTTDGKVYFSDTIVDSYLQKGQLPKMKVSDFISSLIKAFNLVLVPSGSKFELKPLDDWYDDGEVIDLTEYIDAKEIDINRPDLNNEIKFSYKEPKTILQINYEGLNGDYYGDLEYTTDYDGQELGVNLLFENPIGSIISDNTGALTDVRYYPIVDKDLNPVKTEPIIFYLSGNTTLTDDIKFINEDATSTTISTYNNVGQENALVTSDITNSLNWGSEISTWTLTEVTESLFSNYWQTYISNIYDSRIRKYNFTGYVPAQILINLKLNARIIINNRRYIIDSMSADLKNGKVNLTLLNDLRELPAQDLSGGLQYELQAELQ